MSRRAGTLAIGCASMLLIAGCGGDDAPIEPVSTEATSTSGTSLPQDEFIVSADARCEEANVAIANLTSGTESSTAVSQELQITQGVLDGLRGIGEAEDPDGSLESFYASLEEEVRILGEQESAVSSGDTATAASLASDLSLAKAETEDAAVQYGFEECGQAGSALPAGSGTATGTTTTGAPVTPAPTAPTEPAPVTPTEPAPVAPPVTGGGTPTPAPPPPTGGSSGGGSSGGISP